MHRAIELAYLGRGNVSPNPLVGCVVVKDKRIIGEGWHQKAGSAHAEVNAIHSVLYKEDLRSSSLYVTLEPCAHHGRTPPCSDLIIKMGIPEVYIGCIDPFALVAGKGIEKLKKAGIKTHVGVLEKECLGINRRFFTFHNKKRPYIILKWAQSADGFMDIERTPGQMDSFPISHSSASRLTHSWRAEEDAILIGGQTLRTDNPSLTTRKIFGPSPIPIIVTQGKSSTENAKLMDNPKTMVFSKNPKKGDYHFTNWANVYKQLHDKEIQSVMVEGGQSILQQHIDLELFDEIRLWTSPKTLNKGLAAPLLPPIDFSETLMGPDVLKSYRVHG